MKNTLSKEVLVAYASKYGGTAEIAEKIGEMLRQAGLRTGMLPGNRAYTQRGRFVIRVGQHR